MERYPENVLILLCPEIVRSYDERSLLNYSFEHGDIIIYLYVYRYLEILNFYFIAFDLVYEKNIKIRLLTHLSTI